MYSSYVQFRRLGISQKYTMYIAQTEKLIKDYTKYSPILFFVTAQDIYKNNRDTKPIPADVSLVNWLLWLLKGTVQQDGSGRN
jgi:hypothetical protein